MLASNSLSRAWLEFRLPYWTVGPVNVHLPNSVKCMKPHTAPPETTFGPVTRLLLLVNHIQPQLSSWFCFHHGRDYKKEGRSPSTQATPLVGGGGDKTTGKARDETRAARVGIGEKEKRSPVLGVAYEILTMIIRHVSKIQGRKILKR